MPNYTEADVVAMSDAVLVNRFRATRDKRLEHQHIADDLKKDEKLLSDALIARMRHKEQSILASKLWRVTLHEATEPTPEDWPKLYAYIKRTGAFDLLQKRLTVSAVRERWEDGKSVPGISKFTVYSLTSGKV